MRNVWNTISSKNFHSFEKGQQNQLGETSVHTVFKMLQLGKNTNSEEIDTNFGTKRLEIACRLRL